MFVTLIAVLMIAALATRPWRTDDREWFEMSALLEAALLGGSTGVVVGLSRALVEYERSR